jgi:hypothetical protein
LSFGEHYVSTSAPDAGLNDGIGDIRMGLSFGLLSCEGSRCHKFLHFGITHDATDDARSESDISSQEYDVMNAESSLIARGFLMYDTSISFGKLVASICFLAKEIEVAGFLLAPAMAVSDAR